MSPSNDDQQRRRRQGILIVCCALLLLLLFFFCTGRGVSGRVNRYVEGRTESGPVLAAEDREDVSEDVFAKARFSGTEISSGFFMTVFAYLDGTRLVICHTGTGKVAWRMELLDLDGKLLQETSW